MTTLTGTGALLRLALRRDRVLVPAWLLGLTVLTIGTASSFDALYPTAAERAGLALGLGANPALRAFTGPPFDLTTTGGLTAWRLGSLLGLLAGLMSLLLVVRHTRAEEEAGRAELLGSAVIGRYAGLASGVLVAIIANVGLAMLITGGLIGQGLPATGSLDLGLATALAGCCYAAVAAVTAQLAESARAASGLAGVVLGVTFLLRAFGDIGDGTLSWLSPIGWAQQVRPFAGERWWVLLLPLATALVLLAAATALVARRDHGAGLFPARPGPASAGARLRGPLGLAWRLQRGILLGWTAGVAVLAAATGTLASDVKTLAEGNPQLIEILRQLGGGLDIVDAYLSQTLTVIALLSGGYVVQAVLKIRQEETALRAEPVLATALSRYRWAGSHLLWVVVGTVVVLAAAGASTGLLHGLRTGDVSGQLPRLVGIALEQVPAVLVLGAVAVALTGLWPRMTVLAWAAFGACVALVEVGELLQLPDWVLDISPFRHTPQLGASPQAGALLALLAVVIVLGAAGLVGLRRRDIG